MIIMISIEIEKTRWRSIPREEQCNMATIENISHFMLICPKTDTIRERFHDNETIIILYHIKFHNFTFFQMCLKCSLSHQISHLYFFSNVFEMFYILQYNFTLNYSKRLLSI